MINEITYLPDADRVLLEQYTKRLEKVVDPEFRNNLIWKIDELKQRTKPYYECNLDELNELRSQIRDKLRTVSSLVKHSSYVGFSRYLDIVEEFIQLTRLKEILNRKETDDDEDHIVNNMNNKSYGKIKWMPDGELDDE